MKVLTWAAVLVTMLFVVMNLGVAGDSGTDTPYRIGGAVLAAIGVVAAVGLATRRPWGRAAIIGCGALNIVGAVIAVIDDQEGAPVGLVVGALAIVLGALARDAVRRIPAA